MTADFMSRLVGRSAGIALTIEPRLPSLFESTNVEPVVFEFSHLSSATATDTLQAQGPSSQIHAGGRIEKRTGNGWLTAARAPAGILVAQKAVNATGDASGPVPHEDGEGVHSRKVQTDKDSPLETPPTQETHPQHAPPDFFLSEDPATVQLHMPGRAVSGTAFSAPPRGIFAADDPESFQLFTDARRSRAAALDESERVNAAGAENDAAAPGMTTRNISPHWSALEGAARPASAETAVESQAPERHFDRTERFARFAAPPSPSRWRPAPALAETRSLPAAEPVVNITIGRVEVRASVSAAPQTPAPKLGAAPLSLEGYLQNRAGGK